MAEHAPINWQVTGLRGRPSAAKAQIGPNPRQLQRSKPADMTNPMKAILEPKAGQLQGDTRGPKLGASFGSPFYDLKAWNMEFDGHAAVLGCTASCSCREPVGLSLGQRFCGAVTRPHEGHFVCRHHVTCMTLNCWFMA